MNLFYINSFITEKISKRIIEVEGIKRFKMISDERYEPQSREHIPSNKIYNIKKPLKKNLLRNWNNIKKGNKKISKISKGNFSLYIPNKNIEHVRIIMSHSSCEEFSFIEEGFTSYCEFGDINLPRENLERRVKEYIAYMGCITERKIFAEGYLKAYGISDYSFPKWERRKIIEPKISEDKEKLDIEKGSCVLVIDSMRTLDDIKQKIYISTLSKVVNILQNKYEKIYYKLHPDNYIYGNDIMFKSIIEISKVDTEKIDQKHSIERLAVSSGSDVIVNLSSAGLYCLLFSDSEVYTFYGLFRRHAKMAGLESDNILGFERFVPDVFWSNAIPLG